MAHRRTMARRRVVVSLTTGRSFSGVVWAKRGPLLVLRDVSTTDNGRVVHMDGELVVERPMVEFVQVLP